MFKSGINVSAMINIFFKSIRQNDFIGRIDYKKKKQTIEHMDSEKRSKKLLRTSELKKNLILSLLLLFFLLF